MTGKEYHKEQAILQAGMITGWKRERGVYNFNSLPGKAIIALSHQAFAPRLRLLSRSIKGINGKLSAEGSYLYCSAFGNGAPSLLTLLEELQALGVTEFIFLGLCAALSEDMLPGTAFYVEQAWSASGATVFYTPDRMIAPYDPAHVRQLASGMGLEGVTCCSTDNPFRETPSFLAEARAQGCRLLEMECAAAYAFSVFYQVRVSCFLVTADRITDTWTPPADMSRLLEMQQRIVSHIVKVNP